MTPHQTRKTPDSTAPQRTPRLRLKPKSAHTGCVDGAWWPRTGDLALELPDLLAVLSVRLGQPGRVAYQTARWARAPRKLSAGGRAVSLDGYHYQADNTIDVLGVHRGRRLTLLVVPPQTDARQAHATLMAAAHQDNADAVEKLLHAN